MAGRRESWLDAFRALGEAFIEVLRAELAVLAAHWKRSARELGIALALFALAAIFAAVCVVLLLFAAVAGLQVWLGWAGAALAVAGALLVLGALLALAGRYFLVKRFENPVAAARARFDDHRSWLNERVLGERPLLTEGEGDAATHQGDDGGGGAAGEPPPGS